MTLLSRLQALSLKLSERGNQDDVATVAAACHLVMKVEDMLDEPWPTLRAHLAKQLEEMLDAP